MTRATSHVPTGLTPFIPQLVLENATGFIEFVTAAFGARVGDLMPGPDGKGVMHGFVVIDGQTVFVSDEFGPTPKTSSNFFLYVPDTDATVARAVAAGAKVEKPAADMFWGDRWALLQDAFGNHWQIATHLEDLGPDEMKQRMAASMAAGPRP